ncbi:MAG: ATP-dependent Lhr-like helicase [Myxococcota bacterium]|jgi:ATP-dependent Lhr-like helicase
MTQQDSAPLATPATTHPALASFGKATQVWFANAFAAPTAIQTQGWPRIAAREDVLLLAPTGSGKTLAAFLYCLDRVGQLPLERPKGYRAIYVSPLKALVYDIDRNLRAPLAGIAQTAQNTGLSFRSIAVDVRTGDTPQRERQRQSKHPGDILITTPESLYLLLGSKARANFATVETIIIDEIHAVAPTKRGSHLMLSIERLAALCETPPQRIGLSATVRPPEAIAAFLTGGRGATLVNTAEPPRLDLEIVVPLEDMSRPVVGAEQSDRSGSILGIAQEDSLAPERKASVWPSIEPIVLDLVQTHRSTIVFVNSRGLAERLAQNLNELAGEPLVKAHHGSIAHDQRTVIEEMLKHGELRGIVATSSLELGIDMGAVDLVIQIASPDSVARGLQRVGRAGHGVGQTSKARIFPKFRGDLLEAAVIAERMQAGAIESIQIPKNTLDVLAQQIVAMCSMDTWQLADLSALIRQCYTYRDLGDDGLVAVLDMLSGRYPSSEFADLRPRINWDRTTNTLEGRRGARYVSLVNGGTIPDRGLYSVFLGEEGGPRIGELDEEMVHEARTGDTFILGASTWRILEITRDRVLVAPAPGQPGKMPFWHGDGPGRPLETGRAIGAFVRELDAQKPASRDAWLAKGYPLDQLARRNLLAYVSEQKAETGTLPTDRAITVERFRDELGDWRICILTPFGARLHAPWALALESVLTTRAGFEVQSLWSDDGICLRFADTEEVPEYAQLALEPEEVEDLVVERLGSSALFASKFRENAGRALLLPRRNPQGRTPLWQQRLRAQNLLAVAKRYPAFPIILETYRACLQDVFDMGALQEVLGGIRRREIRVDEVVTESPSPFARSLVFAYVAAFLYEGDAPLAERKAQALSLDRNLLAELLGQEQLRDLLDRDVIHEVEAELQWLTSNRRATNPEDLHDLLRRLGALTVASLQERSESPVEPWLSTLEQTRRAIALHVAGRGCWVAVEDVAMYRDALGAVPPSGLPRTLLEPVETPLAALIIRYARTHGPFKLEPLVASLGLHREPIEVVVKGLVAAGRLLEGAFRPGESGTEWCEPEVLRKIRRRTLARLRKAVEPVEGAVLTRFLAGWQGLHETRGGLGRLTEAIAQLEGAAIPFSELEKRILPARVPNYDPRMLDELGAMGVIVWVGAGSLGAKDGKVRLYRRDEAPALLAPTESEAFNEPLHAAILAHLSERGASFLTELQLRCKVDDESPQTKALMEALWDLVWAGLVTNDTFQPLRGLASPSKRRAPQGRARRLGARGVTLTRTAGGRWSHVDDLRLGAPEATTAAHTKVVVLLERYGIVSREVAEAESLVGGFSAIYPILRTMEEMGKIRRGYFVEGLSGAQFAMAGAVDRLRGARNARGEAEVRLMAATDPANPYGALLPWPSAAKEAAALRRAAKASVVTVDGELGLFINGRGTHVVTFAPVREDGRLARRAFEALGQLARQRKNRMLTIEKIDGVSPRGTEWEALLTSVGFVSDYRGLLLAPRA